MADNANSPLLARRLLHAKMRRGLTIQQMADQCGLPKSTLESYMSLTSPKKPGLDALISIADGMNFSLDWLVGRSADNLSRRLTDKDYALACYSTVKGVLIKLSESQESSSEPIFGGGKVSGRDITEVAAEAMFDFSEMLKLFEDQMSDSKEQLAARLRLDPRLLSKLRGPEGDNS